MLSRNRRITVKTEKTYVMKRILNGRYSNRIMMQLFRLKNDRKANITKIGEFDKPLREECPFLRKEYSERELDNFCRELEEEIYAQLEKDDNTYLQIVRMITAMEELKLKNNVEKISKKVRFCKEFYIHVYNNALGDNTEVFKLISLLDN